MALKQITIVASDGQEFGEEVYLRAVVAPERIEIIYETIEGNYCNVTMRSGDTFGVEMDLETFINHCGLEVC